MLCTVRRIAHRRRIWRNCRALIVAKPRARAIGAIDRRTLPRLYSDGIRQSDAEGQSRSNSLMLVLARGRSATRLTITAQAVAGPGWPFFKGLAGSVPGTTTEYSGTSPT